MSPKPFWDVEENIGFESITSPLDSLEYKVWSSGTSGDKIKVSIILSKIRKDMNNLLIYLAKHPEEWFDKPISYGIIHTFDIHIPCLIDLMNGSGGDINSNCIKMGKLFNIQEMTPNEHGIIGLNKPKVIKNIKITLDNGKVVDYEIADKRSIHLTIRNQRNGVIDDYPKILDLFLHEISHTVCNDVRWKQDNHKYPYGVYHKFIRKIAKDAKIMN